MRQLTAHMIDLIGKIDFVRTLSGIIPLADPLRDCRKRWNSCRFLLTVAAAFRPLLHHCGWNAEIIALSGPSVVGEPGAIFINGLRIIGGMVCTPRVVNRVSTLN